MEQLLATLRTISKLSASALSERAGVSRTTLYRIEKGRVDPTVGTLREIAFAAGVDLKISVDDLSDEDAARAARLLLDRQYSVPATPEVEAWAARLKRWNPDGSPVGIVRSAGHSSSLWARQDALHLSGPADELKVAAAGDASRQPWLLSGSPVLSRISGSGSLPVDGPIVIYSADPRRIARLLDHMKQARPPKANVIVAPFPDGLDGDSWSDGPIRLVAPIRGLIDGYGLGGEAELAAERVARSW